MILVGFLRLTGVCGQFFPDVSNDQIMLDAYSGMSSPIWFWIAVVIFAPAFEEGFFRGFLFVGLKQSRLGAIGTIILTAAFWAILHIQYNPFGIGVIFVLGIVLGIVRVKTNSLSYPLIMHAIWNLGQTILMFLLVRGIIA